ncbi:hypothetical protein [Actinoplanes subglobosus]|uniref:Uncharacterized protein n=1 Tax=Actinoplanes subglobosus TaxID=1547892 RepID=A0ABV8IZJ5_9ACTN
MYTHDADLGDLLRGMIVTGKSPDDQIRATVTGDLALEIEFQRNTYDWYDEPRLSRQLAGLGANTWVSWERERREILRRAQSQTIDEAEQERRNPGDERHVRYRDGLRTLHCQGSSPSGTLHIQTIGMIDWRIHIEPDRLRRLREREFIGETVAAFADLMRDREHELILLKAEHYDLGIPRAWQERLRHR